MNGKSKLILLISFLASIGAISTIAQSQPPQATATTVNARALVERNVVLHAIGRAPIGGQGGAGWLNGVPDPDPDANESDKAAWLVFIAINKLASSQQTIAGNSTNDAIWETWADDPLTFPTSPNPASPPQWPATGQTTFLKRLQIPTQILLHELLKQKVPTTEIKSRMLEFQRAHPESNLQPLLQNQSGLLHLNPLHIELVQLGGGEEVRRNKSSFDFIVSNGLWYKQGLAAAFAANKVINFPPDSIEIKAVWVPIQPQQKPQYHWNYDANGKLYGLVGLHLETKALPNWLWATFEWTGNAGRCDYMGCNDSFGATPANVAPATPTGGTYPAGTLTPALLGLMNAAGVPAEFQNYRLKGSQTLFSNTIGQPTLLGNSVIEDGFVSSSSCITCHGQASVDKNGNPNPSFGFSPSGGSSNGPLSPSMFLTGTGQLQYFPIDFVWAISKAN
jgi:hypothetical protein